MIGGDINDLLDENAKNKVSSSEFKRIMQCAPSEPGLDGKRGSLTLLKLVPPSKLNIELIAMNIEKLCEPWRNCHKLLVEVKKGASAKKGIREKMNIKFDVQMQNQLIRIINNTLYYDWPFPYKERFSNAYYSMLKIIFPLLNKINDLMDCAFLITSETSYLKWNVPFPSFVNSPAIHYGDMPWPWEESLETEMELYREAIKHGFSDQNKYHPLDPTSTEPRFDSHDDRLTHPLFDSQKNGKNLMKPGYIQPIISLYKNGSVHYDQYGLGKYKYLVVLTGVDGKALSGLEKIEWLIEHDELAQQIAINARNFGRSYLRLEDQFCYVLTALEQIALVMNNTDALVPFDPLRVSIKSWLS
eukprot:gene5900-8140_t